MVALPGANQEILRFLWTPRTIISKEEKCVCGVGQDNTVLIILLKTKVTAGEW